MKKLGIILDSFSCLTKKEANELNILFLPFQTIIDDQIFVDDGIEYSYASIASKVADAKNFKTSAPNASIVEDTLEKASKEYEHVIYLGISEGLSSGTTNAKAVAQKYKNIYFIDNSFCGRMILDIALYARKLYEEQNKDINDVISALNEIADKTQIFITPFTFDYLIKGGRFSGLKKLFILGLQKIKTFPIVKFQHKVHFHGLSRSKQMAVSKMFKKLIEAIGGENNISNYDFRLIHCDDAANIEITKNIAKKHNITFKTIDVASGIIVVHVGPMGISIGASPKLD